MPVSGQPATVLCSAVPVAEVATVNVNSVPSTSEGLVWTAEPQEVGGGLEAPVPQSNSW